MKCVVIIGGTGFIGTFFSQFLLENKYFDKIYLIDIKPVNSILNKYRRDLLSSDKRLTFIEADARQKLQFSPPEEVTLIANFAAIHREPGHEELEYFETNLLGAENVCNYAERLGCQNIIFTSSISPYGVSESIKDENTLPAPVSPYGVSKLVAEKIHQIWQAKDSKNRRLVIVRPGVVFGPSEGGNVSRLIKAVSHHYFFFMGNKSTRKAGVYVKELCYAMWWVLQQQKNNGEMVSLFNMTMNPGPSIGEYVEAVCLNNGIKQLVPSIPYHILIIIAYIIDSFAKLFSIRHPFSPVRIRKLVRSNNILPNYLVDHGYQFQYSIETAFKDWKKTLPEEWK